MPLQSTGSSGLTVASGTTSRAGSAVGASNAAGSLSGAVGATACCPLMAFETAKTPPPARPSTNIAINPTITGEVLVFLGNISWLLVVADGVGRSIAVLVVVVVFVIELVVPVSPIGVIIGADTEGGAEKTGLSKPVVSG